MVSHDAFCVTRRVLLQSRCKWNHWLWWQYPIRFTDLFWHWNDWLNHAPLSESMTVSIHEWCLPDTQVNDDHLLLSISEQAHIALAFQGASWTSHGDTVRAQTAQETLSGSWDIASVAGRNIASCEDLASSFVRLKNLLLLCNCKLRATESFVKNLAHFLQYGSSFNCSPTILLNTLKQSFLV